MPGVDPLLPRRMVLRRPQAWIAAVLLVATIIVATVLSAQVALPVTAITPIFLPLGIGVAVLARWGRALWPAFVVGDLLGQLLAGETIVTWIALSLACHLAVLLLGATLIRRRGAWLGTLAETASYLLIAVGLALLGAVLGVLGLAVHGFLVGPSDALQVLVFWVLGDLGGYLIAGAAIIAWAAPGTGAALRALGGWVGAIAVTACTAASVLGHLPWLAAAALVGAGLVTARLGNRWGTVAMAAVLGGALWSSVRGEAAFGGATAHEQAFNAMLAMAVFAGGGLLLAGYRVGRGAGGSNPRIAMLVLSASIAIMALADFALADVAVDTGEPLATAALQFAGASLGVLLVRAARAPARRIDRSAALLALAAGVLDGSSLAVYFATMTPLGIGAASALHTWYPVAIIAVLALVARRRPARAALAAVVVVTAGSLVIILGIDIDPRDLLLAYGSAAVFGVSLIILGRSLRTGDPVEVSLVSLATGAVVCFVTVLVLHGPGAFDVSVQSVGLIALAAVGGSLLPMVARAWSMPQLGPAIVGAISALGIAATALLGFAVHPETATVVTVVGLAIMAGGGVLAALAPKPAVA